MDTLKIGSYISRKRKDIGLTQEELALKLGVTNKAVSKWETGKCIPDVSLHENLCSILNITLNELMAGTDIVNTDLQETSEQTLRDVLEKNHQLMAFKDIAIGIFLLLIGRLIPLSDPGEGVSEAIQFIYGVTQGVSIGITLLGVGWLIYGVVNFNKKI